MNPEFLVKSGLILVISGVLLALHTGNFFGFSKAEQNKINEIKRKTIKSDIDKSHITYFIINEFIRRLWKILLVVGVLILIAGVLF